MINELKDVVTALLAKHSDLLPIIESVEQYLVGTGIDDSDVDDDVGHLLIDYKDKKYCIYLGTVRPTLRLMQSRLDTSETIDTCIHRHIYMGSVDQTQNVFFAISEITQTNKGNKDEIST